MALEDGQVAEGTGVDTAVVAGVDPVAPVEGVVTPPAGTAPTTPAWVQPRIDTLTREKFDVTRQKELAEARAAAAEAALDELRRGAAPVEGADPVQRAVGPKMLTLEEAERLAEARAQSMSFQQKTQEVYNAGKAEFKDAFDASLRNLANVGFGNNGASRQLVEAAIETGNPAAVLHELGQDLTAAGQILQLGPAQMGVRLAAMGAKVAAKPKVSGAEEPIPSRVSGTGTTGVKNLYDETLSTEDWIKQRGKTARKRR